MQYDYDIIIIGAGLVGTSLVVALQQQGFRIAILEKNLSVANNLGAQNKLADSRPISLAYGSHIILKTLGVWDELQAYATPINKVHVSEQGRLGTMLFSAAEFGLPALGYVVPFAQLTQTLYRQAARINDVHFLPILELKSLQSSALGAEVIYENTLGEQCLRCKLIVAADGTHSMSRQLLNIASETYDAKEVALSAHLVLSQAHTHVAYERFTTQGVLAILPLQDLHQCRLIWTMPQFKLQEVMQWSEQVFCNQIQSLLADRLHIVGAQLQNSYPLKMETVQEQVRENFVLIGNAAHTLYPIAAQGFNLGLRDVAVLAEVLVNAKTAGESIGNINVLRDYVTWRQRDQKRTIGLTRGISNIFGLQIPLVGFFRSISMLTADLLPPLKRDLAKQMLGLSGRLPRLMRSLQLERSYSNQ